MLGEKNKGKSGVIYAENITIKNRKNLMEKYLLVVQIKLSITSPISHLFP